jgi:16S rRNA (cytidine1402-2'-O)-methyltransferase
MPTLYVVATPIGNMSDISERAKATLASVQVVLCEDTRVTGGLLNKLGINAKMLSYHQHSDRLKTKKIIGLLEEGNDLALVTDAGTPAISDPGGMLVQQLVAHFGEAVTISPIPGPSAVISALSVSGFPVDKFSFMGFAPHKKGRQTYFDNVCAMDTTVAIYESTHRIMKTLNEINERIPDRLMTVCRELTKVHETTYRGVASDVMEQLEATSIKGEFVIVLKSN